MPETLRDGGARSRSPSARASECVVERPRGRFEGSDAWADATNDGKGWSGGDRTRILGQPWCPPPREPPDSFPYASFPYAYRCTATRRADHLPRPHRGKNYGTRDSMSLFLRFKRPEKGRSLTTCRRTEQSRLNVRPTTDVGGPTAQFLRSFATEVSSGSRLITHVTTDSCCDRWPSVAREFYADCHCAAATSNRSRSTGDCWNNRRWGLLGSLAVRSLGIDSNDVDHEVLHRLLERSLATRPRQKLRHLELGRSRS